MATYTAAYYRQKQHKKAKRVNVYEKIVNLGGDYPARIFPNESAYETGVPYANDDVIEVIGLRAGTTVLDVEIDLLTPAFYTDSPQSITFPAYVEIGDGSDTDRYGTFNLQNSRTAAVIHTAEQVNKEGRFGGRFQPYTYASADTIDVKIKNMYLPYAEGYANPANLITTPTFASATGWTVAGAWSIAAGVATRTANAANLSCTSNVTMTAGRYYHLRLDAPTLTAGAFTPTGGSAISAASTRIVQDVRSSTSASFALTSNATHAGTIDNCYLYLLPQNKARFILRVYTIEDARKRLKR